MSATHTHSALVADHHGLGWVIGVSVVVHAALIAVYAGASAMRRPVIDIDETTIITTLVKLGKERDPKLLPRLPTAPRPPAPEVKQLALAAAKEEPIKEKPDKAKELAKPEDDEKERQRAREEALKRIAQRVGDDEAIGSPEGSALGTETQTQKASLTQQYFMRVRERIQELYTLPATIGEAERHRLQATVIIYVAADGAVTRHELERGSGNDDFDAALDAAVQRASPLPAPPSFLRETVQRGVAIKFRP